jgi:hypothetical protein
VYLELQDQQDQQELRDQQDHKGYKDQPVKVVPNQSGYMTLPPDGSEQLLVVITS